MTVTSGLPADSAVRDAIVTERERNVTVIAGAGTGKTKTIIERAVELLAPRAPGVAPLSIKRLAALTFTRRAAGELRFRLREHLLRDFEQGARTRDDRRTAQLRDAISNLDAAFIGTIHGFADRLLRLRPVEAKLSPSYALVEDVSEFVHETFVRMRRAAEAGNLATTLGSHGAKLDHGLLNEAADTLRAASRAGLQMERAETTWGALPSVEALLHSMIDTRDVDVVLPAPADPGTTPARVAAERFAQMVAKLRGASPGTNRLRRFSHALHRLHEMRDPQDAAEAVQIIQDAGRGGTLYKRNFDGDDQAWSAYRAVRLDDVRAGSLGDQLRGPHRWLAARLVRLFPVLRAMYERVKDEHEVVDYLDLLVKLRDVLRRDRDARGFYQHLFDHLFVDEFQDTDPLQCEIVFFLCEAGCNADRWEDVHLTPGKLTIVGDPKQSIYRFRRADIVMYDRAAQRLRKEGALEQQLATNFRSRPELIEFFNNQLLKLLGANTGDPIDANTGRAAYEALLPDPQLAPGAGSVHALPYAGSNGEALLAGPGRAVEAQVVARYIRWLLASDFTVRDPDTRAERLLRPGDIAVLACVTTSLRLLLAEFDGRGIEYSARGGTLFLAHPIARQYLLALRALGDRDDGVATAALLQPPFFGLDCADLIAGGLDTDAHADATVRYRAALDLITTLRRDRLHRSPGVTARDVIERTALGRAAITGRNGRQALAALYEIAWELERRAGLAGLDYDGATALLRGWADAPVFLDTPEAIGDGAVRVMSIHQAKGLEFPVVVLWDGFQLLSDRGGGLWRVDRTGASWALRLGAITVEQPPNSRLLEQDKLFGESERRRMYYVAATRARDLLVLPLPRTKSETLPYANKALADGAPSALVRTFDRYCPDTPPAWATGSAPTAAAAVRPNDALQAELDTQAAAFEQHIVAAAVPSAEPVAITAVARAGEDELDASREHKAASARFGPAFGSVVHRALELLLGGAQSEVDRAVRLAASEIDLAEHLDEARGDVDRALTALRTAGFTIEQGWQLLCEYPIADTRPGALITGFIDLLAVSEQSVVVIDFKSDQPVAGEIADVYPDYAQQLRLYGAALEHSTRADARAIRLGLLFTATGEWRWLEAGAGAG